MPLAITDSTRHQSLACAFVVALACASEVKAACGDNGEPWVSVTFADDTWRDGLAKTVLLDLRADLANHQIQTCGPTEPTTARPPTATVKISMQGLDAVHVIVYVHDAVTNKELSRDVDLTRVPLDGRAFAVALAADELLWASWAEVALQAPQRKMQAPRRLITEVERSIQPPRSTRTRTRVGTQLTLEHSHRGQTQFGPDVVLAAKFSPRLGLRLAGGYGQGLEVQAADGLIQTMSIRIAADLTTDLIQTRLLELAWTAGPESTWCRFSGEARARSLARDFSGWAAFIRTGLIASFRIHEPFWMQVGAGAGYALRGLEATDAGRVITRVSGFQESALLAVVGEL